MREKRVKQILYLWLIGIIFGCSTPEFLVDDNNKSNRNIKMEILNAEAIKKHPRLFTRVSKLNEAILQRNVNQKNVSSSIYNFSINTNRCKMITVDGLTTYTFEVVREQDNGFFENLVVKEKPDGTLETKLYKYNVTSQEKQSILNGIDVDMTNKISTVLIDDPSFVSDIFSKIYFSTFCYEASTINIPGSPCVNGHTDPSQCKLTGEAEAVAPSTQIVYTMVLCPIDETGGGGSGPTGPTDTGEFDGGGTSPIGGGSEIEEEMTPCDYLISMANPSKQNIKPAIDILKEKLNANPSKEWGQDFKMANIPDDYDNFIHSNYLREGSNDDEGTVSTVQGTEWIGSAHIHTANGVNIYSFMDVRNLLLSYNATNTRRRPYVVSMYLGLNNSNTPFPENMTLYAIKIDDVELFQQKIINEIWDNPKYDNLNEFEKAEKINRKIYDKIKPYSPNLVAGFLNVFSGFGISLYKATNQDLTTWSKLTIGSTPYNVIEQPCNQ